MTTLTLTSGDGTETSIKATPSALHAATLDDGRVQVAFTWILDDLAKTDPDGYKVIRAAFPGTSMVAVTADEVSAPQDTPVPPQDPSTSQSADDTEPTDDTEPASVPLFAGTVSDLIMRDDGIRLAAISDAPADGDEPGEDEPLITVTPTAGDTTGLSIDVTVDNQDGGDGTLDFGDSSAPATNAGDGTTSTSHAYAAAGTYTLTFTDTDDPARTATAEITVPSTT